MGSNRFAGAIVLITLTCFSSLSHAAGPATASSTPSRIMDAVPMEAVETYADPRKSEISLGVGIFPFDAYYYGLSVNAGYIYHPSRNFSWEILHAQYFFSFQKDLTTELAQRYSVNPTTITKLNYIISSDVMYVFAYGKFALMENYLRYFRASAIGGLGVVSTGSTNTSTSSFAPTVGLRVEVFTRENFSWNFEARDSVAISGPHNYLTFALGTGFSF